MDKLTVDQLRTFVDLVTAAARRCTPWAPPIVAGWDAKYWIHHVAAKFPSLSREDFNAQLIAAQRAGLLRLARADLVEAMDPADVAAAKTVRTDSSGHPMAEFHFIRIVP